MKQSLIFALLLALSVPLLAMNTYTVASGGSIAAVNPVAGTPGVCTAADGSISIPNAGACVHVLAGTLTLSSHFTTTTNGTSGALIVYVSDTKFGAKIVSSGDPVWDSEGAFNVITGFDISGNGGSTTPCHNILVDGASTIVIGNYVHDMPGGGCSFGGAGIQIGQANGAGANSQILGNILDNIGSSISGPSAFIHCIYDSSSGVIVENNIISRCAGYGIQFNHSLTQIVASNNTIMAARFGGIGISGTSAQPIDNSSIFNDIVVSTGNGTDCGIEERFGNTGPSNVYRGNLLAHNSCPFFFANGARTATGNLCDVAGTGCNVTLLTPTQATLTNIFVNYTGNAKTGDYHLKTGSAAIAAGFTGVCATGGLTPCIPGNDFGGATRPASGAQDMGAYAFTAATSPQVSFTPSPLAFGTVAQGSPASLTATLTNTGTANLTFTAATISGTNAGDFVITSTTCTSPLAAAANCTYSITFTPQATGARSATLTLSDNATGSPHQLPLTGTGGSAALTITPTTLAFGVVATGSTSAILSTTLTNSGSANLTLTIDHLIGTNPGDFNFGGTGTCFNNESLAPGASCTKSIVFIPTANGARSAILQIVSTAPSSPDSVTLTGTGGAPVVGISPTSAACGSHQISTSSTCQVFTLTNTGNVTLSSIALSITGTNAASFSQTNNCPTSLAAAGNCTITLLFTPNSTGAQTASLSIASNAAGSPATAALTGTGTTAPQAVLSTPATFANTLTGTCSVAQAIVLSNNGGTAFTQNSFSTLSPTTNFQFASPVGTCNIGTVAPGASCTTNVQFCPTTTGPLTATFTAFTTAGNPTAVLNGTGIAPTVSLTPASLAFGNQTVGTSSVTQNFTLSNTGSGNLAFTIAKVGSNPGDFTLTTGCTSPLLPGTGCLISLAFLPTTTGARSATVQVTDNASGSPHTSTLSGTGIAATPAVCLSVSSVNFGNQPVSTPSGSLPVNVTNCGTANLVFSGVTPTGDFTETDNCATVAPNAFCTINGTFTPSAAGSRTGQFSIASNSASSPDVITLSGFGTQTGATLTSTASFGHVIVGQTSANINLTLANTGNTALSLNTPTLGGTNPGDFSSGSSCGPSLAANASCLISTSFTPTTTGARSAVLTQSFGGGVASVTSALSGTGDAAAPIATLTPTAIDFGTLTTLATSAAQTIQLQNTGTASLTSIAVTLTGANTGDYSLTNNCGSTLAIGATCTVSVTATPQSVGARTANAHFVSSAASSPQDVTLTVNGVGSPTPKVTYPTSVAFSPPSIQTGMTSAAQSIVVRNSGDGNLVISSATLGGTDPGDYTVSNGCGTVTPGNSCSITLNCVPTAAGSRPATLGINDNTAGSPYTINLTCTGFVGTPTLVLAVSSINFGNQTVGTTSAPLVFSVSNTGTATATSVSITVSGDFTESDTCGTSISASSSCSVTVRFAPLILCGQSEETGCFSNVHQGQITIFSNTSNSPQSVFLQGTAVAVPPPLGPITTAMTGHVKLSGHGAVR